MGSTVLRFYLKAVLLGILQNDDKFDHAPLKIYKKIKELYPSFPALNVWFLDYLGNAYNFRYREDRSRKQFFSKGLRFYFSKYQTLMELDYSILRMAELIDLFNQDISQETAEGIHTAILSSKAHVQLKFRDEFVKNENYYHFNPVKNNSRKKRKEFLKDKDDYVVEYYVDNEENHHEIHYSTSPQIATDFKSRIHGGFKSKENKYSFQPTFRPLEVYLNYFNSATYEKLSFVDESTC